MTETGDDKVKHIGADDADLAPGREVGEYVVREKIGEGGFGTVFRGEHPLIGKQVAIKVLARQFSSDPEMVSRFVAEASAVNKIRNRNIIDIFAFGTLEDGRSYYIMELLDGQPLDEFLDERGQVQLTEALPILRGIARALDAAHAKGIAHRDLKPENVYLQLEDDQPPFPKLLDFGIAKLLSKEETRKHKTRTGAPIGTPLYMSPEQCRGRDVDHRTDIYAFGVMVYQMLVGEVPFDDDNYMDILMMQINDEARAPSVVSPHLPSSLDEPILWMLAKKAEDRPPNLATALQAVEDAAVASGLDVPTLPPLSGVLSAQKPDSATGLGGLPTQQAGETLSEPAAPVRTDPFSVQPSGPGRMWLVGGLLAAGVITAVAAYWLLSLGAGDGEVQPTVVASADAAPQQVEPRADAAAVAPALDAAPAPSKYVTIDILGPPAGTEVYGPGGKLFGVAPGPIQLERGETEVVLTFKKAGYYPKTAPVSAADDSSLEVELARKRIRRPRGKKTGTKTGGKKPTNSRNTIESPFK